MAAASIHFGKAAPAAKGLRKKAGAWLKLGFKYYTFVSQVENRFGTIS